MAINPLAAIQQYIDAFKGNREGMSAAFAVPGSILDGWLRICGWDEQPLRIDIEMF